MKLLFLCTTEFQLMTALNIKYHVHPNDEADIIVGNYHGEEKALADRLRKTKLFRKVFYVRSNIENNTLHKFFKELMDGEPTIKLKDAVCNSLNYAWIKFMELLGGPKQYVLNMIDHFSELEFGKYDMLLTYGAKPITSNLVDLILITNINCRIVLMDEGFGIPSLGKYSTPEIIEKIDKCYTYALDIVMHTIPNEKGVKIPVIKRTDMKFIKILNDVFQFHENDVEDYRNAVIFFNPNGGESKMPWYLKNNLTKILFHRLYEKHLKEEKSYYKILHLADLAVQYCHNVGTMNKIWIKLNPRATKDQIEAYKKRDDIRLMKRWDLPWELLLLNCPVGKNVFLTDCSASVCLCRDVVEPLDTNICRILLYRLAQEKFSTAHDCFFENLNEKYEDIFIPATVDELNCIR